MSANELIIKHEITTQRGAKDKQLYLHLPITEKTHYTHARIV